MTPKHPRRLNQKRILLLGLVVGAAIIGISWIALMWGILAARPGTNILAFAKAELVPTAIMIFAWTRAHRELKTKSWGHNHVGSLGWFAAGILVAWVILQFSWGFDIDAGDASGIITFAQFDAVQGLFFGGWALAWLIYLIGIARRDIELE